MIGTRIVGAYEEPEMIGVERLQSLGTINRSSEQSSDFIRFANYKQRVTKQTQTAIDTQTFVQILNLNQKLHIKPSESKKTQTRRPQKNKQYGIHISDFCQNVDP